MCGLKPFNKVYRGKLYCIEKSAQRKFTAVNFEDNPYRVSFQTRKPIGVNQ
jgi:hypothetical protein